VGPYKYYHYYNSVILGIPAFQNPGSPDHPPNRHCPPNPRKKNSLISPCNFFPSFQVGCTKYPPPFFFPSPRFILYFSGLTDELELAGTRTISARGQRNPALAKSSPKNSSSGCHQKLFSGNNLNPISRNTYPDPYKQKLTTLIIPQTLRTEL
jgi:hypothetical protein